MKKSHSADRKKVMITEDFFNNAKRMINEGVSSLQILMTILNCKVKNKKCEKLENIDNKNKTNSFKEILLSNQLFPPNQKTKEYFYAKVI